MNKKEKNKKEKLIQTYSNDGITGLEWIYQQK